MSFRESLFQYRSYTPIPFLAVMVLFAQPATLTMAVGFAVAVIGELVRFWGVAYAGSLTRVASVGAPEVILAGPFAYVRNPLYIGNILLYTGIGIMSNALMPWLQILALVYFSFQYGMIVSLEEEFLEKEFGAAYMEFKKNVPRFIPRWTPYEHSAQASQQPKWAEAGQSEKRTLQAIVLVMLLLIVLWYRG